MFCPKCGAKNPDGSKFCGGCGNVLNPVNPVPQAPVNSVSPASSVPPVNPQPVQQPQAPVTPPPQVEVVPNPQAPQEKIDYVAKGKSALNDLWQLVKPLYEKAKDLVLRNKKIALGIAGGIAVILIACIVLGVLTGGSDFTTVEHDIQFLQSDGELVIVYDGKVIKTGIEEEIDFGMYSLDASVYAFTTEDDELYVFNGKKVTKVADDVDSFIISNDGTGLLYLVDEEDASMYLYNISKKKKVTVLSDANDVEGADISPDGDSVLYSLYEDGEYEVVHFNGKKDTVIVSGEYFGMGLSNDGKYIYVSNEETGDLYCFNTKGDREKIASEVDNIYFNADHTQVLMHKDGKTYISTKGKEPVKISGNKIVPLLPENAFNNNGVYPIDDLYEKVYTGRDGNNVRCAWFIEKNPDKSSKLATDINSIQYDSSCEYLYYIDSNDNLKYLEIADGDSASEKAVKLASDVDGYILTSDRDLVYYASEEIFYSANGKNGKNKRVICSDEVDQVAINADDVVFYMVDGDIYATSNGKKGKRVCTDMDYLSSSLGIVYASCDDEIYVSTGGNKLKKILTIDD